MSSSLEKRDQDCESLQRQLQVSRQDLDIARNQLSELQNSRSWKITAPLRLLGDYFRASAR